MYLLFTDIICSKFRKNFFKLILIVLFVIYNNYCEVEAASRIIATFNSRTQINNLIVLENSGRLIIGSINRLYSLNSTNLKLIQDAVTGPLLDSPLCNPELSSCIGPRDSIVETDNYNKILHLIGQDLDNNNPLLLLVCGSVRQGVCELRDIANLDRKISSHVSFGGNFQNIPVAANSANASTVSLLVDDERLFVGATHSYDSPYRESFPAVSTRLAPAGLLPINSGSIDGEAAVHVRAEYRTRFRINYVDAFRDERYVYWAAVQNKYVQPPSLSNPLVSRLIRVCQDDDKYISYSEIEIQCRSGADNTNFNVLKAIKRLGEDLIGIFNDSEGKNSAICIFNMPKIRLTFWYNIDRCRSGTDSIGLPHIGRDAKCINKSHLPLTEDTCQLGVGGTIEASQVAALEFAERQLISVDAREVDSRILVLIGTKQGEILQMELSGEHNRRLTQYSEYVVGPDPVHKIQFLDGRRFLAVLNKEIMILHLSSCAVSQTLTCSQCAAQRDPLCGWCLNEGKCLRQSECGTTLLKKCPTSNGPIDPRNASIVADSKETKIFVPVKDLPAPDDDKTPYECYFGVFKSIAEWSPDGLNCTLPKQRPRIDRLSERGTQVADSSSITLSLAIRSSSSRANILTQDFVFYNCALFSVCSLCTTSKWPCRWCASEHNCFSSNDLQKCSSSDTSGSTKCAKINTNSLPEILIADSTNASVSFSVLNMLDDNVKSTQSSLYCTVRPFDAPGSKSNLEIVKVSATLKHGRVQCSSAFFNYTTPIAFQNYTLELSKANEMIDKTSLTLYKCNQMASDCSQCMALDPKWRCTWCNFGCNYYEICGTAEQNLNGLQADFLCTQPFIESFSPKYGPREGGTQIEIVGRDLGSRIQDVQERVYVAGVKCRVVGYEISKRITCVLERPTKVSPTTGSVRVSIGRVGKRTVESRDQFQFQDPLLKSIYPIFGPVSGGTRLTIYGENLNIGHNISVHLDNLECHTIPITGNNSLAESGQLTCITSSSQRPYTVTAIRVQIDSAIRLLHAKFTYRPDPTIISLEPFTSFESGGRLITVKGTNFESVLSAKIFLLDTSSVLLTDSSRSDSDVGDLVSELGNCRILNATQMQCQTPRLTLSPSLRESSVYARWSVGFYMDGVKAVRNLGHRIQLRTVPDPQFSAFKGVKLQSADQPLLIEGNYLSQAANVEDYIVTIGTENCVVFLLDTNQLLCRLPEQQPDPTDDQGIELNDGHPLVVVRVGSLRAELGPIDIDWSGVQGNSFSLAGGGTLLRMNLLKFLLLLFCAIGILIFAAMALFWFWRRKGNEHERVYKRIQMQMEQMESNVRNECKQAFAELQTDVMCDLTAAIDDVGIPYQNKGEFVSRLLFRDSIESSILNGYGHSGMGIYSSQLPIALAQFDSLLWNKQFVFLLVHCVETDPSVSATERATISSLLLVALSRNMSYCTDVIFSLLSAHIEKCVTSKQSHLLFRKSESLVEKLFQQWLMFCLYSYLTDESSSADNYSNNGSPARSFFLLYKALKYQTEKGPVDCVNGNARYSLSEQKLLRETVTANNLSLLIIPVDGFDQAPILCKVLDCDTISQLKWKLLDLLYRNQPFSTRITIDQFDLEWNCPKRGSILLLDDDRPQVKGIKKLNTIAYYNLPNNALLTMQTRGTQSFTFGSGSSDTTCSVWSSTQLIETTHSPVNNLNTTTLSSSNGFDDTQYYHLSQPTSSSSLSSGYGTSRSYSLMGRNRSMTTTENNKFTKRRRRKSLPVSKSKNNSSKNILEDPFCSISSQQTNNPSTRTIPEVFLTRLLMCKGTIQRFVESFFNAVMFIEEDGITYSNNVPLVIQYVLDYLDDEASKNNMSDPEILHSWKTNAIILRFWMQLLHNPDCLFDVQRQPCLDASLIVIGQTLMDAFSRSSLPLGKESPSSKLLFAKEISRYRPVAQQMFKRLSRRDHFTQQQLHRNTLLMGQHSLPKVSHNNNNNNKKSFENNAPQLSSKQFYEYIGTFSKSTLSDNGNVGLSSTAAVGELLNWVKANGLRLVELLDEDTMAVKHRLGDRLRQIVQCSILEPEHIYATLQ